MNFTAKKYIEKRLVENFTLSLKIRNDCNACYGNIAGFAIHLATDEDTV